MIVTGGSRGIGAATCRQAAQAGYAVCVNYQANAAAAEALVAEIEGAGGRAIAVQGDMAREDDVTRLFETSDAQLGQLTALVANAGIVGQGGPLDQADRGMIRDVVELNVLGLIYCCQAAVQRMSSTRGGAGGGIVTLSSMAAFLGAPGEYTWYAASKGAVESFTLGLSKEVAGQGIRVNAVAPGLIETDIHASGGDAGRLQRLLPGVPMGRAGTAEEVAESVLWLLSDASSYVTGTSIRISGGR